MELCRLATESKSIPSDPLYATLATTRNTVFDPLGVNEVDAIEFATPSNLATECPFATPETQVGLAVPVAVKL
jgi:hypothetical protein